MNYEEVLNFMFNSLPMYQRIGQAAYKADLNNTMVLDEYFNHPHKHFKTIHIAGTNGKGSVSHSLASILQEAGYKTGLYTSPHLVDFRERIRVNGEMITEAYITDFINNNYEIIKNIEPSFFEMSVALTFEYFKFTGVDVAVIEVGMGGRLDSTNIITPDLSVITNIGLDHTQFLGDTLAKIAGEKAGIIKKEIPVVIGETHPETKNIFEEKACKLNSPILFADDIYKAVKKDKERFLITGKDKKREFIYGLAGNYQVKNLPAILLAADKLKESGYHINNDNIENGLANIVKNTGLRGRWEELQREPLVICDTGHNKEGLNYVIPAILSQEYKKLHIVLGFVNDKNINEVLKLFPTNAEYYFTQADIPRAMPVDKLYEEAKNYKLIGNIYSDVKNAYLAALSNAQKDDMIFVGGSTFVVGDLLKEIEK